MQGRISSPPGLGLRGWQGSRACRKNTQGCKPLLFIAAVASVAAGAAVAVAFRLKSLHTTLFNETLQLSDMQQTELSKSLTACFNFAAPGWLERDDAEAFSQVTDPITRDSTAMSMLRVSMLSDAE